VKSLSGELRTREINESFTESNSSGVDVNKFDPATVVPLPNVNQRGFWEAPMDSVSINDKDLGFQNRSAIMDTGQFVPYRLFDPVK
jgi:hypothetical protein